MTVIRGAVVALCALASPALTQASTPIPIDQAARGTMVTVQGTVERHLDTDEFRLADTSGQISVYVGPNWIPADLGETVIVHGFVDDDFGPREIYARTLTRADGTVITFEHRYD